MKKTLIESRPIRFYVLLWVLFVIGMVIAFTFDEEQNQWRDLALAGFILSVVSLLITLSMLFPVQEEIKTRYPEAINAEKVFLTGLFYFARGFFFLIGTLILISSLNRKDVLAKDLVEISGEVTSVEVYGGDSSNLKVIFENNSNEYETKTFNIPDGKLEQIENELEPGNSVLVLIDRDDQNAVNDPYVQIYGIRTETYTYLSLDEYNEANALNDSIGFGLGAIFAGPGLIYLLVGRIKPKPKGVLKIDQNGSRA